MAIDTVTRPRDDSRSRLETLQCLARACDEATHQHTESVASTAARLAEALGLPAAEVELIRLAAPLHDIGKVAVPDAILLKPASLTPAEAEVMRGHSAAGAAILAGSASGVLCVAQEIARSHHEWWDGSGYPDGLAGEAIPLCGRIVALADVFDALVHARPYKPAWPPAVALEEIERLSGRQFDPAVVAAFRTLD